MSAMPIEWHEECLKNNQLSLGALRQELSHLKQRIEAQSEDVQFRKQQIAEAKKQGKTSFDSERFLIKRVKPCKK